MRTRCSWKTFNFKMNMLLTILYYAIKSLAIMLQNVNNIL